MEIPAGKQLLRLFARMAGGGPDAATDGAIGVIGATVIGVDQAGATEGCQRWFG
jgi:hypothetical protein